MNNDHMDGDDAFVDRIAGPLRAPERAPADMEARVMGEVRRIRDQLQARRLDRPWLLRPRSFAATPLAALALAAGFAAVVLAGASLVRARPAPELPIAAVGADTVHLVRFVLVNSGARSVTLVGSFNQWEKDATPLREISPGVWVAQVPLGAARHEYAFVVRDANGERWLADPAALATRDEFGTESSVIDLTAISSS
jgi:hypothetical protein